MIKALTIFFLFARSVTFAQETDTLPGITDSLTGTADTVHGIVETVSGIAETQSGQYIVRDTLLQLGHIEFAPDTVNNIRREKAYAYMANLDSLLRLSNQPDAKRDSLSGPSLLARILFSPVIRILMWIVGIAVVLFILYKLFSTGGFFFRRRKDSAVEIDDEALEDHVARDFKGLFNEAAMQGDYRLAIRYLFLQTLVRLGDAESITIAPGKTNMNYVSEVSDSLKPDFRKLVSRYEWIWYGQRAIDKQNFDDLVMQFQKFNNQIPGN